MVEKEKAKKILKILNKIYPTTPIPLNHTSNFTLLMSVLLSAQCTDLNVNNVTKNIYPKYYTPNHFVKLGKKKIVLDRGPSHPKFDHAKPWMNIYYVLFRHRPKWFPFNILIHEMLADDHGEGVHTHLCPYVTIILRGGYWETTKKGKFWRPPGYVGFRSANNLHRVDLEPGIKPMTIFIPGPFGLRKGPRSEYGIDFKTKK